MDKEISFCPYCNTPSHKILSQDETSFFCRECNTFFSLKQIHLKCPKCDSDKIEDSDFPSPDGQIILQCRHCKKMFSAKDLLSHNDMGKK
jgi:hypothetical protein